MDNVIIRFHNVAETLLSGPF